ncbi:MAG TPA: serine/threonine-protein kinase [Terriglobales bacterium]|jgi:serine/threonine protein kinase|nr:serine/threonine-protein kinase [Terriglobales bacterium]
MISTNKASIGRYEILGEIGRGAMGVVYKARDPHIDRIVAIKTISLFDLEPADEREYRERFQQEARTAGRLTHPGIVAIFDVGADPETNAPYIVMEYIAGSSLTSVLADDRGKLPLSPALRMVEEVAEALDYAHSEGVTHRDVKPANILLTPEGRAKLADFGIARLDQSHLTLPGRLMGSPAYMAPEQMRGEDVDGRSDLFALGVVLYRLSTGYRPFQGNSTATVCYKLLRQDPLPPSALNSDLPPELDEFLVRAMAKDPDQRFQTGKEMAAALRELRQIAELKQDPLEPLRRIIDRTGVSHAPEVPAREPLIFEVPLPELEAVSTPAPVANPVVAKVVVTKIAVKKPDPWLKFALVAASAVVLLAGGLIWSAHRHANAAAQEAQEIQARTAVVSPPPAQVQQAAVDIENTPPAKASAAKADRPVQRKRTRTVFETKTTEAAASADSEQPIVVHNMDLAKLDVVIEHGFDNATATVLVDQKPIYSQELHGESKRRALLFRRTSGRESGTINLLPGKHDIVVRVQSPTDSYDASRTLSEGFAQGSKRVLHVKCDKKKNKLDAVIQ